MEGVAGLGGLAVQAHCLSGYSHFPLPQPPAHAIISLARGYPMVNFGKGLRQEIIIGKIFLHAQ